MLQVRLKKVRWTLFNIQELDWKARYFRCPNQALKWTSNLVYRSVWCEHNIMRVEYSNLPFKKWKCIPQVIKWSTHTRNSRSYFNVGKKSIQKGKNFHITLLEFLWEFVSLRRYIPAAGLWKIDPLFVRTALKWLNLPISIANSRLHVILT